MTRPNISPQIKFFSPETNTTQATANATINIISDDVKYGDNIKVVETREITPENEKNVYKLLLDAYRDNPLKVNECVVMKGDDLCELIKQLTEAESVEIEADVDISCCGKDNKYNVIKNIICIDKSGTRLDFEVGYNKDYRLLQDYKISLLFTYT